MAENFNRYFSNTQDNIMAQNFNNYSNTQENIIQPHAINQLQKTPVTNFEDIANKVITAIQPMFTRLTNEVQSLRKELQELKKDKKKVKRIMMPAQPFKHMQAFLDFEKGLQENLENITSFENELAQVAKAPSFVRNCWRRLVEDELAEQLCWKGTEAKKGVKNLTTTRAVRNAAISVGNTEDLFIKDTRTFFQFAKNRIKQRGSSKSNFN